MAYRIFDEQSWGRDDKKTIDDQVVGFQLVCSYFFYLSILVIYIFRGDIFRIDSFKKPFFVFGDQGVLKIFLAQFGKANKELLIRIKMRQMGQLVIQVFFERGFGKLLYQVIIVQIAFKGLYFRGFDHQGSILGYKVDKFIIWRGLFLATQKKPDQK